jgi:hypothetical protein
MRRCVSRFLPETKALLRCFARARLSIVHAQYAVGARQTTNGFGTALDLILKDRDGRLIPAEIKFNFGTYWDRALGRLESPLGHVPSCPLHHAILQLLMGVELARRSDPRLRMLRPECGIVFRVVGQRVDAFPVSRFPWWSRARAAILSMLTPNH